MSGAEQRIPATIDRMTTAVARHDVDGIMATYEHGATVVCEPGAAVSGRGAVREAFAERLTIDPKFELGEHDVVVAGDISLHVVPRTMKATAPDGSGIAKDGLSVAMLRRQPGGDWLMVIDDAHGRRVASVR